VQKLVMRRSKLRTIVANASVSPPWTRSMIVVRELSESQHSTGSSLAASVISFPEEIDTEEGQHDLPSTIVQRNKTEQHQGF
jgi:hypothetical protein